MYLREFFNSLCKGNMGQLGRAARRARTRSQGRDEVVREGVRVVSHLASPVRSHPAFP
jgi:hypothetical protein